MTGIIVHRAFSQDPHGIRLSANLGADGVELDVRERSSGFIVSHDENGEGVLLEKMMELACDLGLLVYLDIKELYNPRAFINLIEPYDVIVGSFDWDTVSRIKSMSEVPVSLLFKSEPPEAMVVEALKRDVDFLHPCLESFVNRMKMLDDLARIWEIERIVGWCEPEDAVKLEMMGRGIRYVMTDSPSFLESARSRERLSEFLLLEE